MTGEQAKFFAAQMVQSMRQEMATTSKVLAAVNEDKRDYRPDPKSRSAWQIATHIATSDAWFVNSAMDGAFAFDGEAQAEAEAALKTVPDAVAFYQRAIGAALDRVDAASSEDLVRDVDFFGMMKAPAVTFLMLANNHSIHHRGQLSAHLRAMGSKVPDIYGPSGDSGS
jgi:uncharacterized damage-inducible protein DinB